MGENNIITASNEDFRIMAENRKRLEREMTFDDYIDFVTQVNAFAGHPVRPFKPITGDTFLL